MTLNELSNVSGPSINRYPIYKEKIFWQKKENKTQFSLVKNKLMVYQNKYSQGG